MNDMNCPHCQSEDIVPESVPNGVVAVMPCPKCAHLLVRFRNKVIALNRDILINGSKEERTFHLAEVIAEFMDDTDFNFDMLAPRILDEAPGFSHPKDKAEQEDNEIVEISQDEFLEDLEPITDDEAQRFVDFELNAIDNMDYFKKHLE
jgi:hypothetical protein